VVQLARLGDGTHVVNMHLSTVPRLARDELAHALALVGESSPLIFGGDLNLRDPVVAGMEHVAARDVDHVFVRGFELDGEVLKPDRRLESGALLSDHEALLVPLAPRSPQSAQ
jgi:endonuclease/exonuclease/phosphatase (EEP) superfamily protein YafD